MLVLIRDDAGRTFECLLLSATPHRMRLAFPNTPDAIEIEYAFGQWITEEGKKIEIVAILSDGSFSANIILSMAVAT